MEDKVIKEIRNPKYNRDGITIDCEILHLELGWLPFSANPDDVEEHGRDAYQRILDGEAGEIEPYVVDLEYEASLVRGRRDQLIKETDWTQLPDVPDSTKTLWEPYRQALRDVPQQEGFPLNFIWPEKPILE